MASFSSGGGHYEINGLAVSASEFKTYGRFFNLLHRSSDRKPADVKQLEQQLHAAFFSPPQRLRAFIWDLISHSAQHFSPDFRVTALVEALTAVPTGSPFNLTSLATMQAAETLPEDWWPKLAEQIEQRLPTLEVSRQAVASEVLTRIAAKRKALSDLRERRVGAVEVWLAVWLELLRNGAFSFHADAPQMPPIPQGDDRLALLQKLLQLDPHEYQPPATASEYERAVFPGQWWAARQQALTVILGESLTRAEETLIMRELVEKEHSPLERLGLNFKEFDSALYPVVKKWQAAQQISAFALAALRRTLLKAYQPSPDLKWVNDVKTPELNPGEAWSDAFLAKLDALPAAERAPWPELMVFARSASAGKPSAKWLGAAQKHLDAVGAANFSAVLTAALPLLSKPRTFPLNPAHYGPDPNLVLDEFNALSLKGLLWMLPLATDAALTRQLSGVVESALKKVPGVGPRAPKIANAAVYASRKSSPRQRCRLWHG